MKKSTDWNTQAHVDAVANDLLREAGDDIEKVTGNRIATALGMTRANESIYTKLEDWKQRKLSEGFDKIGHAPAGLGEELEHHLRAHGENIVSLVTGLAGKAIVEGRHRSEQTEGLLRERIVALESELDRAREAELVADLKLETLLNERDAAKTLAATNLARAEQAEARLEELRANYDGLVEQLGRFNIREYPMRSSAASKSGDGAGIDMSRYDYRD
ncbi:hypothetical protein [Citromicrobium bathyomarinum]|uniref:hypothetical protein n=1 Tax=Citromicrobium bathyomarinum TaxID=72174 RepID=UPI001E480B1D|nr:hypothetical protein [Citromicrobium bathyomarinum]MCD1623150.1 hypothetical protein [Citromicrobium bathyomarinum]